MERGKALDVMIDVMLDMDDDTKHDVLDELLRLMEPEELRLVMRGCDRLRGECGRELRRRGAATLV